LVGQVKVGTAALQVEALDGRVEVDQPDRHAGDADDRQPGPVALALDQAPLLHVEVERIGEDVDGVEADLAGHADAVGRVAAGLGPGGVDEAEFHGAPPVSCRGGWRRLYEWGRNPNIEIRNPNTQIQDGAAAVGFEFRIWIFGLVSDFDIRISRAAGYGRSSHVRVMRATGPATRRRTNGTGSRAYGPGSTCTRAGEARSPAW